MRPNSPTAPAGKAAYDPDSRVMVYSSGLVACSVCAPIDLPIAQVEQTVNLINPTGIESQWRASSDPTFAQGGEQPGACEQMPESRIHYLMEC